MNVFFKTYQSKLTALLVLVLLFPGCGEYFDNPLIDKETGEEINLLIIDFNFFKTSMTYKFIDASDGVQITEDATVKFMGQNSGDIVTFAGEKKEDFRTSEGQLELTIDPNVSISESTPFEFAINVDIDGYNSLAKGIQIQNEGKKTFELYLSKIADEREIDLTGTLDFSDGDTIFYFTASTNVNKSASVAEKPYSINYWVTMSNLLKFKNAHGNVLFDSADEVLKAYDYDPGNFLKLTVRLFANYKPGIELLQIGGEVKNVLFQKLETGRMVGLKVGSMAVADFGGGEVNSVCNFTDDNQQDLDGFAKFENNSWNMLGKEVAYSAPGFGYTLAIIIEEEVCATGGEISFLSELKSSFAIDVDVYDLNDNFIMAMNYKGNFPETFVMENVPKIPVKLVFRNNNPAFAPIPTMEVDNLCTGKYEIPVSATEGFFEYQIVLKAICADNPAVGIAPTYSAEVRIKESDDDWQGVAMTSGVTNVLGKPNVEYELRLLWEGVWEYSSYFTDFDADGNYSHPLDPGTKVELRKLDDGRTQIYIERIFSQGICDDLGW